MNTNLTIFFIISIVVHLTHGQGLCPTVYSLWSFVYRDTPGPVIMKFQKQRTSSIIYQCVHTWVIDCECFTIQKRYMASSNTKISNRNNQDEGWAAIWKNPEADSAYSNVWAVQWKDVDECQGQDAIKQYLTFAYKVKQFDSYRFVSQKELELGRTVQNSRTFVEPVGRLLRQKYSQMKITWADSELGPVRRSFNVVLNIPDPLS